MIYPEYMLMTASQISCESTRNKYSREMNKLSDEQTTGMGKLIKFQCICLI